MAALLALANMSIEPIVSLYVATLVRSPAMVTVMSGLVMAASALGSVVAAAPAGRLADRFGHRRAVLCGLLACAALLPPQAMVTNGWELLGLRLLMGMALAGLMPAITSMIRQSVPAGIAGRILALATSATYAGTVLGPLLGAEVAAHAGMRPVFWITSAMMLLGAWVARCCLDRSPG